MRFLFWLCWGLWAIAVALLIAGWFRGNDEVSDLGLLLALVAVPLLRWVYLIAKRIFDEAKEDPRT